MERTRPYIPRVLVPAAALVLASVGLSAWSLWASHSAGLWWRDAAQARRELSLFARQARSAERLALVALLEPGPANWQAARQACAALPVGLEGAATRLADTPEQRARLADARTRVAALTDLWPARESPPPPAAARRAFAGLSSALDALERGESERVAGRGDAFIQHSAFALALSLVGCSLAGVVTVAALVALRRDLRRRVAERDALEAGVRERTGQLTRAADSLRAVLAAAPDAILAVNAAGVVESANPAADALFGPAAGRPLGELLPGSLDGGPGPREGTGRRPDGTAFPAELSVGDPAPGPDRPDSVRIVVARDASDRKRLEERSLRSQRLESIGTLAGGIAHDLNNIMTPLLMATKLLQRERPGVDRKALLATAQASVERGAQLVRQLLAFAGGIEGRRVALDVSVVLDEVVALLSHTLPKAVAIETRVPPGLWPVLGDSTQLAQVFMNLCVNARDAMDPAGGTLALAARGVRLARPPGPGLGAGDYLLVTVEDTGSGIPTGVLEQIFDPFFTTKEVGKGTGLGLSTALGIVRAHGGCINVYTEPGRGTRMAVYLPARPETPAPPDPRSAARPRLGRGEMVLVVDDEPLIRDTVSSLLDGYGYRPVTAADGLAGVDAVARHGREVRLVLLDMMMPRLDGREALARMRAARPGLPVILASGLRPGPGDAAAPNQRFLQKPYTDDELLRAVAELIDAAPREGL